MILVDIVNGSGWSPEGRRSITTYCPNYGISAVRQHLHKYILAGKHFLKTLPVWITPFKHAQEKREQEKQKANGSKVERWGFFMHAINCKLEPSGASSAQLTNKILGCCQDVAKWLLGCSESLFTGPSQKAYSKFLYPSFSVSLWDFSTCFIIHQEAIANLTTTSHISPQQVARLEESHMQVTYLCLKL